MRNNKTICLLMTALLMFGAALSSCSDDEDISEKNDPEEIDDNGNENENENGDEDDTMKAHITDTLSYNDAQSLINYNFVYPSTDPFGEKVMLSGTITVNTAVETDKKADGLVLYNHYTVFKENECPSKGYLDIQKL